MLRWLFKSGVFAVHDVVDVMMVVMIVMTSSKGAYWSAD